MITEIARGRWLVSTACNDCFLDVQTFGVLTDATEPEWRGIDVSVLSKHKGRFDYRLRSRIRRAWQILRGGGDDFIELVDARETDDMIEALIDARIEAFGDPTPENQEAIRLFGQG